MVCVFVSECVRMRPKLPGKSSVEPKWIHSSWLMQKGESEMKFTLACFLARLFARSLICWLACFSVFPLVCTLYSNFKLYRLIIQIFQFTCWYFSARLRSEAERRAGGRGGMFVSIHFAHHVFLLLFGFICAYVFFAFYFGQQIAATTKLTKAVKWSMPLCWAHRTHTNTQP